MKTNNKFDQDDYLGANATLRDEISTLEAQLKTSGKAIPARPSAATGEDAIAANDSLTSHKAMLIGIASNMKPAASIAHQGGKENLTAKILKARGVSSLAELQAKHQETLD